MTPPNRLLVAVAVIASAAVAFPAAASAKMPKPGEATFQQTYPVASNLCAKVAAGTENRHLKADLAVAQTACTALESTFTLAASTVLTARTALEPQIAADKAASAAACSTGQPVLTCNHTRHTDRAAITALAAELRVAKHTYFITVNSARSTFWSAIHTIPGEHRATADLPLPVPPA
jgi:hypothetical protein